MDSEGRLQIRFTNAAEVRSLEALQEETGKGQGTSLKLLLRWWYAQGKPPLTAIPNSEGDA